MRQKIKDLEDRVGRDLMQINYLESRQTLESLEATSGRSLQAMQKFLSLAERNLKVVEKHRDLTKDQRDLIKEQLERKRSDDEEKCHQAFLTSDVSYEWYKSRVDNRVEGTCQWFITQPRFKEWLVRDSGPLLVQLILGVGNLSWPNTSSTKNCHDLQQSTTSSSRTQTRPLSTKLFARCCINSSLRSRV